MFPFDPGGVMVDKISRLLLSVSSQFPFDPGGIVDSQCSSDSGVAGSHFPFYPGVVSVGPNMFLSLNLGIGVVNRSIQGGTRVSWDQISVQAKLLQTFLVMT